MNSSILWYPLLYKLSQYSLKTAIENWVNIGITCGSSYASLIAKGNILQSLVDIYLSIKVRSTEKAQEMCPEFMSK